MHVFACQVRATVDDLDLRVVRVTPLSAS